MKKLLVFLLIFAIFLTGCNTAAPADEGAIPPTDDVGNETTDATQNSGAPSDEPTENTPAAKPLTVWKAQEEPDDFWVECEVGSGTFARGESMRLRIVVCNNMETVFTVRDLFFDRIKLITIVDGEEYVIYPREMNAVPEIFAAELRPGGKYDCIRDFDIPSNAPLGEYILVCPYENITKGFEGYFTLTQ